MEYSAALPLEKRSDAISSLLVATHVAFTLTPLYCAAAIGPSPLLIALCIWFGAAMHGLLNLMHETAHWHVFRERAHSDRLGNWLLGPLVITDFEAYRARHWQRHRELGLPGDTKFTHRMSLEPRALVRFVLRCLLLSEALGKVARASGVDRASAGDASAGRVLPRWLARAALLQGLSVASLVATAYASHEPGWAPPLVAAALAYVFVYAYGLAAVTSFVAAIRSVAEHRDGPDDVLRAGSAALRNFRSGPLSRLFLSGYGFAEHATHHHHPGVPAYRLRALTHELAREEPRLAPRRVILHRGACCLRMNDGEPVPEIGCCALCGGSDVRVLFEKLGRNFLRCRGCGLVRIDPMPTQSELSDYYASAYAGGRYTHFASAGDVRSLIASHRAQRVSELVSPGHWLDIGCSTGDFVAAALEAGARGEGIDISGPAVEQARARGLVAHHSGVEDFEPAEPFDAITAFDVVEHLLDPRDFLTRVCEWLRPGATLVLTTPDVSSLYPRLLMGRHWFYYWPDEHLFYFEPSTISCLLTEVGFVDVSVTRAHKPLTLRYSAQNLQAFNPLLGRLATRLVAVLPDGLAGRTFHISVGEMMAVARRPQ